MWNGIETFTFGWRPLNPSCRAALFVLFSQKKAILCTSMQQLSCMLRLTVDTRFRLVSKTINQRIFMKSKTFLYSIFLLALLGASAAPASAQRTRTVQLRTTEDAVYLKNGWILRGNLQGIDSAGKLTIVTHDRNTFVFAMSEVIKIQEEPLPEAWLQPINKGRAAAGLHVAKAGDFYFMIMSGIPLQATASVGIKTKWKGLRAGVGAGYSLHPDWFYSGGIVPVFAELQTNAQLAHRASPWLMARGGYSIPDFNNDVSWWGGGQISDYHTKGGSYMELSVGAQIRTASSFEWKFYTGFRYQQVSESYNRVFNNWQTGEVTLTPTSMRYNFRRPNIGVAISF